MQTVFKTTLLEASGKQSYSIQKDAEIINVREQGREIAVWYRCDRDAEKELRCIEVVGTGWDGPDPSAVYLGSAHFNDGALVFHIFEHRA